MNALFLKDLADKTHRGLRGRVEGGKSAGGLCYGYRVVKSLSGGSVTTGERETEPGEAAIVERIFREFVAGVAPKALPGDSIRIGSPDRSAEAGVPAQFTGTRNGEPAS
jgi:site-specific DNA recombinase